MLLGKAVRINRLFSKQSRRCIFVALDHGISYDYKIHRGIDRIPKILKEIVDGNPNSIVLHKGIANKCFMEYAGRIPLIIQCTANTPGIPWRDYQLTFVEETIALGADAVSMAIGIIGEYQGEEIAMLSKLVKDAIPFGMPVIGYIYPKGNTAKREDFYALKYVKYAAHVGAEIGLDVVKVPYTGSLDSFAEVVAACPTKLVVAGGPKADSINDTLKMTYDVVKTGASGITFGRSIWQDEYIVAILEALKAIVHQEATVEESMEIYKELSDKKSSALLNNK